MQKHPSLLEPSSYRAQLSAPTSPSPVRNRGGQGAGGGGVRKSAITAASRLSGAPGSGYTKGFIYAYNSRAGASRDDSDMANRPSASHRARQRREDTGSSASTGTSDPGARVVKTAIFRGRPLSTDTRGTSNASPSSSGTNTDADEYHRIEVEDATIIVDEDPDESTGTVIAVDLSVPSSSRKDRDIDLDDVKEQKRGNTGSLRQRQRRQHSQQQLVVSENRGLEKGRENSG